MQLDQLLEQDDFIFRLPDGEWPKDLPGAFERALTRSKLLLDGAGDKRSLYSLRHTYATNALVSGQASIHEIALNMGTSVYMIERHYSHLKVVQKARELSAGTRDMYASTSFGDVYSKAVEEESVRTERRAKMRRDEASRKEKFKEFEANIDKYLNGDSEEEKK